jgi:hypothetical protein
MAKNNQPQSVDEIFITKVKQVDALIRQLRSQAVMFVAPKVTSDPTHPVEGQIWENTTTHQLKWIKNGAVTVIS